jgi:hypothetical protein
MRLWHCGLAGSRFVLLPLLLSLLSLTCVRHANELGFFGTAAAPRSDRPLRLRIHVSGAYAAQAIGTHAHIRRIVGDADRILSSSVGAHLVVEEIVDGWKVDVGRTEDALNALIAEDAGGDVDIVVGMLGPMGSRADGCGGKALLGRDHMVVRSEDHDDATDHRVAVVMFLHELGHALGAPHDHSPGSIMNADGASATASFTEASVQILQSGLARRGIVAESRSAIAGARVAPLPRPDARYANSARKIVADADGPTLETALQAERRGDPQAAWQTAEPLFSAYPDVLDVQDLRCRLARARDLPWSQVRIECAPLMRLTMLGANPLE